MSLLKKRTACLLLAGLLLTGCSRDIGGTPSVPGTDPVQTTVSQMETATAQTTAPTTAETTAATAQTTAPVETTSPAPTTVPAATTAPVETTAPAQPTVPAATTAQTSAPEATTAPEAPPAPTVDSEALGQEAQALSQSGAAVSGNVTVEAPGIQVKSGGGAVIDYSNARQGYVMVKFEEATSQRLKVRIVGPSTTYTYNLTPQQWTAFPLSDQTGEYQIVVYINVVDTKYAVVLSLSTKVALADEFAPFLHSNQYVNFDIAPNTVAKAAALTGSISDPLGKVQAVYDYVVGNMTYDSALAATVTSGYLPNLDSVLAKMSGICFDYASLMTGMLRSQGIPAKLVVGYAGEVYHAWISVWSEETGWVDGVIYFDGFAWKRMDPTFASTGGDGIMDYIGNSANYTAKYFY